MTTAPLRCPEWPPPEDEHIGPDRARNYIAWIREHAAPVLAQIDARLMYRDGVDCLYGGVSCDGEYLDHPRW